MKTFATLLTIFLTTSTLLFGQISLEHTYVGGSTLAASPQTDAKQPLMVNLEVDGQKYVIIDRIAKTVTFYNLNHTFYKSISFALTTDVNPFSDQYDILYISQNLFDTDNEIEFMYVDRYFSGSTFFCITQIVNEDGSLLFTENAGAPMVRWNSPQQQLPIYNTPLGTKLILSMTNGDANVYSLTGVLTTSIINNSSTDIALGNPFPNPTKDVITIPYSLPENEKKGTIIIYNIEGKEINSYSVDNNFKNITLTTTELPSGTYYYQLRTSKGQIDTKKIIKVE
jgi:Secretion system C-terminal sorting domain